MLVTWFDYHCTPKKRVWNRYHRYVTVRRSPRRLNISLSQKWFQRCRKLPDWLVISNIFHFPFHIWDVILPIDELIFFKMVKITNQLIIVFRIIGFRWRGSFNTNPLYLKTSKNWRPCSLFGTGPGPVTGWVTRVIYLITWGCLFDMFAWCG